MTDVDFLIVGSGLAGASVAFELAPEARVLVVERESAHGYHTTGRSAALYMAGYGNETIRRLTAASGAFFEAPPEGFSEHPLLSPRGCLYVAGPGEMGALETLLADIRSTGVEAEMLSAEAVLARVPILYAGAVVAGVLEPGASDVDVNALHQGYLRGARARGAEIRTSSGVIGLARQGDHWRATLSDGSEVSAGVVIDAAGAWAGEVAAMAGARPIAMAPLRRTAMLLDAPPGQTIAGWPVVIDVHERFYFKPDAGKIFASPADETPSNPCDAFADDMDVAECIERIQAVADLPVTRAPRSWAGLRTFAPDRSPVVGYDPEAPGFFWLAGQGGYGVQTAPAMARAAAALALGRGLPADLTERGLSETDLSPGRAFQA